MAVVVFGPFDDIRSRHVRLLQEASRLGELTVQLWTDAAIQRLTGCPPKFTELERKYLLEAIRFVHRVELVDAPGGPDELPMLGGNAQLTWVVPEWEHTSAKERYCAAHGIGYRVITEAELAGFPDPIGFAPERPGRSKVIVTGCYDWLHSGHVRFFEEASAFGDLYVGVGNDANIRALKGEGHPLFPEAERRYMVASVRYVYQAFVNSGFGWIDAEPEILRLRPDYYVVNEDGDKGGKREFCQRHGIRYVVLKREPAPGLPRRSSTELRGY